MKDTYKFKLKLVKEQAFRCIHMNKLDRIKEFLINDIHLSKEAEEVVLLIGLDTQLNMTGFFEVSRGSIEESLCVPRDVFKRLLLANASAFVIAHNHPSENLEPSLEDINNARAFREASEIMGIKMVDYLIAAGDNIISFKKENIF